MPIYEYACHDCGKQFETLVRSDTVPACPACGSVQLEKPVCVCHDRGHRTGGRRDAKPVRVLRQSGRSGGLRV